ncbi:hypothetical protein ACTXT7_001148 [Hymenolepis weldensis]
MNVSRQKKPCYSHNSQKSPELNDNTELREYQIKNIYFCPALPDKSSSSAHLSVGFIVSIFRDLLMRPKYSDDCVRKKRKAAVYDSLSVQIRRALNSQNSSMLLRLYITSLPVR